MRNELRRPPAFQEYASDVRSHPVYQMMTNDERAVWHGLRYALSVADEVATDDTATLARVLMMNEADLRRGLTERVLDLFSRVPGHPERIHSPELDMQMQRLAERRRERAESGRKGAQTRYGHSSASGLADSSASGIGIARADARGGEEKSGAERSAVNTKNNNPVSQEKALPISNKETTRRRPHRWRRRAPVATLEPESPEPNEYEKASRGY